MTSESSKSPKIWGILPAAGTGKRAGFTFPKQYFKFKDKTLIEYTIEALLSYSLLHQLIVMISADDEIWPTLNMEVNPKIITAQGGSERMLSVWNGLQSIQGDASFDDWVLVHDAARPLIDKQQIAQLMSEIENHPDGGILGSPVRDTLKWVDEAGNIIKKTSDRTNLWMAATPQVFRYGRLVDAFQVLLSKKVMVTDEAQAIELFGGTPKMVATGKTNLKFTYPEDIELISMMLDKSPDLP